MKGYCRDPKIADYFEVVIVGVDEQYWGRLLTLQEPTPIAWPGARVPMCELKLTLYRPKVGERRWEFKVQSELAAVCAPNVGRRVLNFEERQSSPK